MNDKTKKTPPPDNGFGTDEFPTGPMLGETSETDLRKTLQRQQINRTESAFAFGAMNQTGHDGKKSCQVSCMRRASASQYDGRDDATKPDRQRSLVAGCRAKKQVVTLAGVHLTEEQVQPGYFPRLVAFTCSTEHREGKDGTIYQDVDDIRFLGESLSV